MDRVALYRHLSAIVKLATGVPTCTIADDNHGSPTGSYATIEPYGSISERGQANQRSVESVDPLNTDMSFSRQLVVRASINFYRDNAKLYAAKLHNANKRPDVAQLLRDAGIGWNSTSAVNDLTALQGGKAEQRAQISLVFWMELTDELVYNRILSADVDIQEY